MGSSWFCLVLILPGSLAWNPLNLLSAELVGGQHSGQLWGAGKAKQVETS